MSELAKQQAPLSEDAKILEKNLKRKSGAFTIGDMASLSGLGLIETEYGLKELLVKYRSKLHVTENGDLIYDFGKKLVRRNQKTSAEKTEERRAKLWKAFKAFYKFLISTVLVVYFVVFVVILIAMVVAMMSGGKGNNRRGGTSGIFRMISEMFNSIFFYNSHRRRTYKPRDPWGYPYEHYEPRKTKFPKKPYELEPGENPKNKRLSEKSFVGSVYDFVLGPPRVDISPLANKQEVASYLRQTKGLISATEVQALAGWTRNEAEEFLTTCLVEFDGEAKINDNATFYGEFPLLLRSTDDTNDVPVEFFWDEYEPEYELTGNSTTRNMQIIGMNTFNLAFAGYVIGGGLTAFIDAGLAGTLFLGAFPLLYSVSFFAIPVLRSFHVKKMQQKQHVQNIRKRLLKVIYKKHQDKISLQELTETANQWRKTEEKLSESTVNKVVTDFIYDLEGEPAIDENAEMYYEFHRLRRELVDMKQHRDILELDRDLGKRLDL